MITPITTTNREEGISIVAVLVAILIVVTLALGGFSIWSYSQYRDQKDNTDAKIGTAVTAAKSTQNATDEATFAQQEKLPNTTFTGPSDYGSVSFHYPKTWSEYLSDGEDGNGGNYEAYFNPGHVPTVSDTQQFALRVTIESEDYETVLSSYTSLVKKGTLKSSIVTTNGLSGTRLDGQFSSTIDGSVVIFKVRDKTLLVQTDSPSFVDDFNTTIVSSLTFTP